MDYLDVSFAALRFFERPVTWLYRDSKGNATTATGDLVEGPIAAYAYPFFNPDGTPATANQIAAEYARVMAMPPNLKADAYRTPDALLLQESWVGDRLRRRIAGFEVSLGVIFPEYAEQPDAAKVAEIDMIFNMGLGTTSPPHGFRGYPHMIAAIQNGDYETAAAESGREPGDPAFDARNAWTKQQFLNAAQNLPPTVPS